MRPITLAATVAAFFLLGSQSAQAFTIIRAGLTTGGYGYFVGSPGAVVTGTVKKTRRSRPDQCGLVVFKNSSTYNNSTLTGYAALPVDTTPTCENSLEDGYSLDRSNYPTTWKNATGDIFIKNVTDFDRSKDYVSVASLPVTYNKCGIAKINTKNLGNANFAEPIITYNGLAISGVQWNPRQIYKPPICVGTTQYVHGDNATMTTIP